MASFAHGVAQTTGPAPKGEPGERARPRPPTPQTPPDTQAPPQDEAAPGKDKAGARRHALRPPGASIPTDPAKRAQLQRDLYAMLATAESQESATAVAAAIERLWAAGVGDTVIVLMDRATKAAAEERPDLALRMLDTVTRIAPDLPEGFNRRAFLYYTLKDLERAMGDLRRVLALDPSHYKALDGLGQILREIGNKKAALGVYRRLLAVHPYWPGAKTVLDELEREVGGQES